MIDPADPDYADTPVSDRRPRFGYSPADAGSSPYVTIVTPFYNTGPVFHETARSVLAQSFQQWEWVIVDDGSTDPESRSVLDCYREGDPRIRIVGHATNRGVGAARNMGFRAARAEYVVQVDSDDLLEPTAIEKWLWFLESYPEFGFVNGFSVGFGADEYLWCRGCHEGSAVLEDNLVDTLSMVRRGVHKEVGGYDEGNRDGLEDWDFWLRCADRGHWGATLPEYLRWYRRRVDHTARWANWHDEEKRRAFRDGLRRRYPRLWEGGFPQIRPRPHLPNQVVLAKLPCENFLQKDKPRLLMVVPWMDTGGADKFNLDLVEQMAEAGWEVTIATTLRGDNRWLSQFARYTPDIFIMPRFLRLVDYPRFLRYLIASRRADVVLISNSDLGYLLLPYLRTHCPGVTFVDYCHGEQEGWKNGGYPRAAVEFQELLDLNLVSSEYLKGWMVQRGADPERVRVCHINVDTEAWRPDSGRRRAVRQELGLADDLPVILYAGRICAEKQPLVFAESMLLLQEKGLPFVALVAGDGPDYEWLRGLVAERALASRVLLLGEVSSQRMKELMSAVDIFFLPSQWEGIAATCYEAMASGLPVVGADVGGQRELVTPECGVLVQRSDGEAEAQRYAAALAGLLANFERRSAMGRAGRGRVETHFRREQMLERMLELFAEAAGLRENRPRPIPSLGLARACANQAVEYTRLSELTDIRPEQYPGPWGEVDDRDRTIRELQAWSHELERGKTWLEEQWTRWMQLAKEREEMIYELKAWIDELERTKAWWEAQAATWQRLAEEREVAREGG